MAVGTNNLLGRLFATYRQYSSCGFAHMTWSEQASASIDWLLAARCQGPLRKEQRVPNALRVANVHVTRGDVVCVPYRGLFDII